jgi:hypothetical protein
MKWILWYIKNLLTAIDQLGNAIIGSWCDETISSHAYRLYRDKDIWVPMYLINTLFINRYHCWEAYLGERFRLDSPPEERPRRGII